VHHALADLRLTVEREVQRNAMIKTTEASRRVESKTPISVPGFKSNTEMTGLIASSGIGAVLDYEVIT